MFKYIIHRLLILVPLLFTVSFISFMVIKLAPGDILAQYRNNPHYSEKLVNSIERQYKLDKPALIQYFFWLKNILLLDFGYSFSKQAPVGMVISGYALNTLILSLFTLVLSWTVAIPLGIYCAVNQYKLPDKFFSFFSYIGMSIPTFLLALLFLYFASLLGELPLIGAIPIGGMKSSHYDTLPLIGKFFDILKHLFIPGMVLVIWSIAGYQRQMRGSMLEELRMRYVTTARAKGLPEHRVVYIHALRNAINPLITIFGMSLPNLLAGAAFTEIITSWPGLGSIMLQAVRTQDQFLIMANLIITGALMIIGNLLADVLLTFADPRIKLS